MNNEIKKPQCVDLQGNVYELGIRGTTSNSISEENSNPFFDFNAKIEATIKDAKNIIEKHKEDNSCEPPDFVCLAYDTINCLNELKKEVEELKEYKWKYEELSK